MYKAPKKYYIISAVAIVIFFSGITINYQIRKTNDIKKEINILTNLSEKFKYGLMAWLNDKKEDTESILQIPYVKKKIHKLLTKNELNEEETHFLYSVIENIKQNLSFDRILILGTDLKVKLSTSSNEKLYNDEIENLNKVLNLSKPIFSDFHFHESTKKFELDLFVPIFASDNKSKLLGILIAEINPKELISTTILLPYHPIAKTSEFILTQKKRNKILVINKLKLVNNEPLKMEIKPSNNENDFYGFIKNNIGSFLGLDYRNKRVISVVSNVPGLNWKIISKIDEDEILSPLKREVAFQYILLISVVLVIWFILTTISKKRESDYYQKKYLSEKEKKEAEARILLQATALQASPNAIIITDENGDVEWCNRAFTKMTGYKFDESLGKRLINMIDIDSDYKELYENINKKINVGETWSGEFKNKHKNGTIIYTETTITPFYDEVENKTKFITVKQDITEQREAEIALKKSEQHYRNLFNGLNDLVSTHDLEGYILTINPKAVKQLGYKKEEMLNKNFSEILAPEAKNQFRDYLAKIKKEGRAKGLMLVQTRTGEKRIWEYNNSLVKIGSNEQFISGIARDVTDVKKAEKAIQESEERYRSLFEDSLAGVYLSSFEGELLDCNDAFVKMFGYSSKEELKKVPAYQYYENKDDRDIFLKKVKEKGILINYEEKLKKKDGSFIWTLQNVRLINNRIQGTIVDISADIKSRNALIEAKEKAEEANRIKSNFLANMSHELRTPMVGILGFTEILVNEIEKPELKEYASMIHESANRLTETLNLILNLTKIEADKINVELSKIDVIRNTKKTVSIFDKLAAQKNIYLKFESALEKFETETDERMFGQIISNLVNNAVKFTEKGGVTVSVNKVKNDSYLEIKVKDTGIGIPKDKQELIWEKFRQVSEGASRVYEGTGLGLTIANNFVHKLGGEIKLGSEPNKGSTFTVLLPIREKAIADKTKKPALATTTETTKTKETKEELKSLLYVEDDKISREVVECFLRGIYKIDIAHNGEEGIKKAKKKKYDGILMDINLQAKIDGTETAKKIKEMEEYKEVPIVAVTAYAMVGDREKYLGAGFTEYISKPFNKNDLIVLLNNVMKIDE